MMQGLTKTMYCSKEKRVGSACTSSHSSRCLSKSDWSGDYMYLGDVIPSSGITVKIESDGKDCDDDNRILTNEEAVHDQELEGKSEVVLHDQELEGKCDVYVPDQELGGKCDREVPAQELEGKCDMAVHDQELEGKCEVALHDQETEGKGDIAVHEQEFERKCDVDVPDKEINENLMDVETELSNEIGFIKVDNSGLEAGDRNIIDEYGSLHRYVEKEMEIIKSSHEHYIRIIDEIRSETIGELMRIEKIFHDLSLSARHIIAGLKTRLPLLPTAVNQERLHVTLDNIISRLHTNPRKIFYRPEQPYCYIDVDMESRWTIPESMKFTKSKWTPFVGKQITGKVRRVMLRGEVAYIDGEVITHPGFGFDIRSYKHYQRQVRSQQLQVLIPTGTYAGSAPLSEPSSLRKPVQQPSFDRLSIKPSRGVESYTPYEKLMDFETELSNEIGFIKVDNSGIEAGDRNILDEHGFLHQCLSLELIMPRAWTIFTRVPKMTIIEIDEIRGEQIGIEKIWNEFGLSGITVKIESDDKDCDDDNGILTNEEAVHDQELEGKSEVVLHDQELEGKCDVYVPDQELRGKCDR